MIDSVPYRFPTAEERWPRQGEVASITKPYEFPKLVVEEHEGFYVVRDDLLEGGSKRRFVDRMIREEIAEGAEEFVYGGCPANGYAQLSLTLQAKAYGKKAVFFMAKRSLDNLHPYQKQALEYGADIRWVPNGMLQVTKARAREYFYEDPKKRRLLPLGLEEKRVFEDIKALAKNIEIEYNIKVSEVWSVGSSGTLTRGLQMAFPDKEVNVVSVGHKMKQHEIGRANLYLTKYKFMQEVKEEDKPPFPSVPTYDAKAWAVMKQYAKKGALFWNVGK